MNIPKCQVTGKLFNLIGYKCTQTVPAVLFCDYSPTKIENTSLLVKIFVYLNIHYVMPNSLPYTLLFSIGLIGESEAKKSTIS